MATWQHTISCPGLHEDASSHANITRPKTRIAEAQSGCLPNSDFLFSAPIVYPVLVRLQIGDSILEKLFTSIYNIIGFSRLGAVGIRESQYTRKGAKCDPGRSAAGENRDHADPKAKDGEHSGYRER